MNFLSILGLTLVLATISMEILECKGWSNEVLPENSTTNLTNLRQGRMWAPWTYASPSGRGRFNVGQSSSYKPSSSASSSYKPSNSQSSSNKPSNSQSSNYQPSYYQPSYYQPYYYQPYYYQPNYYDPSYYQPNYYYPSYNQLYYGR